MARWEGPGPRIGGCGCGGPGQERFVNGGRDSLW